MIKALKPAGSLECGVIQHCRYLVAAIIPKVKNNYIPLAYKAKIRHLCGIMASASGDPDHHVFEELMKGLRLTPRNALLLQHADLIFRRLHPETAEDRAGVLGPSSLPHTIYDVPQSLVFPRPDVLDEEYLLLKLGGFPFNALRTQHRPTLAQYLESKNGDLEPLRQLAGRCQAYSQHALKLGRSRLDLWVCAGAVVRGLEQHPLSRAGWSDEIKDWMPTQLLLPQGSFGSARRYPGPDTGRRRVEFTAWTKETRIGD